VPWDWRILLNGKGDELMYERHVIVTGGLPFAELKTRSLIDTRARAANDSPDFSTLIRKGLPFALPSDASRQRRRPDHRNILESSREIDAGRHLRQNLAPGCSMVCPVATLSALCGTHDILLLAILRRLVSAPLSADT